MSATLPAPQHIDRDRVATLMERERARLRERTAGSGEYLRARLRRHARRRAVAVPEERPVADVPHARLRRARSGTSTATSTPTSTTASASCASATRTRSIAAAVKARMDEGTHFAAPTEGSIIVAEELRRRWGLPHWRFTNSGTESTMDADPPRARAHRPRHDRQDRGHLPRPPRRRDGLGQAARRTRWATARSRTRVAYGLGFAPGTAEDTRVVPFNDADALDALPPSSTARWPA